MFNNVDKFTIATRGIIVHIINIQPARQRYINMEMLILL